ncbi:MAG: ArsA-related P-loop ATPase [Thermodesulfobacteriota bacterium]
MDGKEPAAAEHGLSHLVHDARVVVCLGPGGVGKTTSAAAIAVAAALAGRRVAVLTVDPAARLKDALELPRDPGRLHRVPLPEDAPGTLDAILLDAKGLFDGLVRRLSPSPALAERVLANPVYRNVAGAFAGSDAYMALEQLLDIVHGEDFDLVVVDTPPASHALELFDAPERILALLNSRALEYLGEPVRILGGASSRLARTLLSAVLSGLERMTGLSLLRDVSTLATDFGVVSPEFKKRAQAIRDLLRAPDTRYVLLAAPDPHGATDVLAFAAEVDRAGVAIDAVIVNRVLQDGLATRRSAHGIDTRPASDDGTSPHAVRRWPSHLARNLVACARDLATLRAAQQEIIDRLRGGLAAIDGGGRRGAPAERVWVLLPALSPAPTSLDGVVALARALEVGRPRSTTAA